MSKKLQGNGLWESSRMVLPEHRERIIQEGDRAMAKAAAKRKPVLDELELEDLANKLAEAMEEEKELVLTIWGRDEPVKGRITKLDPDTKRVHVERYGEVIKVPFFDILKAENPDW